MKNLYYRTKVVRPSVLFKVIVMLKFILILTLAFSTPVFSKDFEQQKMDISLNNVSLKKALKQVERISHYRFLYHDELFTSNFQNNTVEMKNVSIDEVMKFLLRKTSLKYEFQSDNLIIISGAKNQAIPISGSVKDEKGLPLVGVSIIEKGTTNGTTSDANGNYRISVSGKSSILSFRYLGFTMQDVTVGERTILNIALQPESSTLNEVVVVAFGSQKRANVTGSISTVNANEIKDLPVTQFSQKLQGKIAGVQINQTSGVPGQGMSVRIRGALSIGGGSQPLYVVDGFPIVGDISNINPDEIESFSVLKDASATALYGSRAANGVFLIQTKKAKDGQSNISLNAFYGIQSVPEKGRPDMMNAEEFAQFQNELYSDKIKAGTATSIPAEYQNPAQYRGGGTDWYDVLLQTAPIQNYSLSLTSGKDKLSTAATIGYISQKGVLINSDYKRYSVRLNSEYKFNDKVTIGLNVAPSYATNNTPNTDGNIFGGGIIQSAIATSPLAPYINPDGSLPLTATSTGLFPNPNWYRVAQEVKNDTRTGRILSNVFGNVEIIKGLNFKTSVNIDYTNQQYNRFSPSTAGALFAPPPNLTSATERNFVNYSWLTENTLNYTRSFGDHNFDVLVGYTAQKFHSDYSNVDATGFPNDKIQSLAAATQFIPTYDTQEWSLASLVSRLNYNYKGKYLLSASFRRDGSSRFGPNVKYGNFPAVSAGWNVSDEDFMKNLTFVSNLKIRAGYGLNGNFNIGNYSYLVNTSTTNYPYNGTLSPGYALSNIGNNSLTWEKSKQLDVGFDLGLLKNRIFFSYDYFNKTTTDMLLNVDVPTGTGFSSVTTNAGKFKFTGHEFAITSQNLIGTLKWSTNFNITFIKNKVVNVDPYVGLLPRGDPNNPTINQVGSPIGLFYGYKFLGVYKDQQDFNSSPKYANSAVGTVKMADVNGDGKIDLNDLTVIGDPNPDFTFGITNNLYYKNFDFTIVASGSYGNDIQNRTLEYIQNLDGVFNVTKDVARRWKSVTDPGDGIHPKAGAYTIERNTNSRWVSDGSYLTIKNVTLGYTLPIKENKYLKNLRLYTSVQQLFVFTKYDGANPEVNSYNGSSTGLVQGIDNTTYPVPRTFNFGINLNLK
ncbi:TonB-dependent receptor [Pedobacter jejuensis]|nr:TonB-dependent receptor [Pedobacter jejuensis]